MNPLRKKTSLAIAPEVKLPVEVPGRPDIAAIDASIAELHAEMDKANRLVSDILAEGEAWRADMAALGGEPQPGDFDTAEEWLAAKGRREFALAKLQPKIAEIDRRQMEAAAAPALLGERMRLLETNRQRAVVQHKLTDLEEVSRTFTDALRAYSVELRRLDGANSSGLYVTDRKGIVRGFTARHYGDFERIDLVLNVPTN